MKTYISAAQAGGQGKTTIAQMLYCMLQRRGDDVRLVAADFVDETEHSKIGKFFPTQVLELGIGAELQSSKLENDANAPLRYWDRLGGILLHGGAIIDVGANVVSPLMQWARHRRVSEVMRNRKAPEIDVFFSTRAERHAIDNAASLIREMVEEESLPIANVYVVCNEVGGPFAPNQVEAVIGRGGLRSKIHYVTLPHCTSELWPILERTSTPVDRAIAMSPDDIAETFGVDIFVATAALSDLKDWADGVWRNFKAVGI